MDDITTRLRRWTHDVDAVPASDLMDEAAAEIERLRWRVMTLESAARWAKSQAKLGSSPNHDAAPAAKAMQSRDCSGVLSGTGDTPSEAEVDALEYVVVNGRTASLGDYGILRQWLVRMRPEFDSAEDVDEDDSDRSQPIADAVKTNPTPLRNGTPAEGSVPGEGRIPDSRTENEPAAWWIKGVEYDTGCEYEYVAMLKEQADAAAAAGATVTPLYRQPPPVAWQLVHDNERLLDEVMLLRCAIRNLLKSVNDRYPLKNQHDWECQHMAELDRLVSTDDSK